MASKRRQAIKWTNANPIHWCIYATLGREELTFPVWSTKYDEQTSIPTDALAPCAAKSLADMVLAM